MAEGFPSNPLIGQMHPTHVVPVFAETQLPNGTKIQVTILYTPFGSLHLMFNKEDAIEFWKMGLENAQAMSDLTIASELPEFLKRNGHKS